MYWLLVLTACFFWLCAAVSGWQDGYGFGGALAGALFFVPVVTLWPVRDNPFV